MARILTITGGSSIAAMIFKCRCSSEVFNFDVEDPFEKRGLTHVRRRALRCALSVKGRLAGSAYWE